MFVFCFKNRQSNLPHRVCHCMYNYIYIMIQIMRMIFFKSDAESDNKMLKKHNAKVKKALEAKGNATILPVAKEASLKNFIEKV